ncbi:VG15 protein [Streptomyces exfoliatus]|uniref:VG15 protein n=1 Tax=Streptomyces exfoliatus TaxID=1905 RepID=UPI0037B6923C
MAETDVVSAAFHIALSEIGAKTTAEALALWRDVPPERRAATAGAWLRKAITLVMSRRRQSRDLARAYYRLARALQTGRTVADPYHPEPSHVSLADLRREFAELAGTYKPHTRRAGEAATVDDGEASPARQIEGDEGELGGDRVLVEELEGLREDEELVERQAEAELRIVLEALGTANLDRRLTLDDTDPDEAHRQAGAQQAAAASRVAMNGARSSNWTHMRRDRRALGYVRLSRTGTPCGWCAMLISRGPVYKSRESATFNDGDRYHDNCHCYAMPVWNRDQYQSSELTALSRQYEALWPEVTKGHTGKDAVSVWRRFVRQKQRAAAQEARQSTTTTPEA